MKPNIPTLAMLVATSCADPCADYSDKLTIVDHMWMDPESSLMVEVDHGTCEYDDFRANISALIAQNMDPVTGDEIENGRYFEVAIRCEAEDEVAVATEAYWDYSDDDGPDGQWEKSDAFILCPYVADDYKMWSTDWHGIDNDLPENVSPNQAFNWFVDNSGYNWVAYNDCEKLLNSCRSAGVLLSVM